MKTYRALTLFKEQLERNISGKTFRQKVVITPTSLKEKGVVVTVSLLKSVPDDARMTKFSTRTVKVRVAVQGSLESQTGLEQACEAIESLDEYLSQPNLHLKEWKETDEAMESEVSIPNTRIIQKISAEDSFVGSPDSTELQYADDDRIVLITIPKGDET